MRILHTSDWHLGRSFGEVSLLPQQRAFVDWLVALVERDAVDLVVVAGDLHDRAVPPAEAVTLLSDAIRRLREAGAEVAAIAGNHDSGERVGAFDGLVDAGGVVLRGGYDAASKVTVREFADGPLAIVATPFLEPLLAPDALRSSLVGESVGPRLSHEAVLRHALSSARAALPDGVRSLVLAHAFVTGAAPSPSERELAVGDAGMVSVELFEGFDYVALGHLHRPQTVAGLDHVRYSGSPLPYAFGETHTKEVVLVDLDPAGVVATRTVPIEVGRSVRTVRGSFAELVDGPLVDDAWIRVELTDPTVVTDAHRRLRARFPHLVELECVGRHDRRTPRLGARELEVRSPAELARAFWADVSPAGLDDRVGAVLDAAVEAARAEDSAA